ncbi:MAG: Gfo/Idh/MocA family oxidoreductase [Saprospiraceae bacterium]|nr:Gfo/Idh/MocA family oxidoreductase [Saprospiraceae bacterium]
MFLNTLDKSFHCLVTLFMFGLFTSNTWCQAQNKTPDPMPVAIAGLTHDHVHGLLRQLDRKDFIVVGIAESDLNLAKRYSERYGFDMNMVYPSLSEMLHETDPEAVLGFGSTYDHLQIVEVCAPAGIHVMVEKPMAVSLDHAKKMESLIKEYDIKFLVNYETTWYPTHYRMKKLVDNDSIGPLRKFVVHDGHEGPREIGCSEEFLSWLTDPELNGGGAVTDFGCYGANLITWLMQGEKPTQVLATLQQIKPDIYPDVDDEANILLTYPSAVGIIQASWNWPFSRKDMEVYGKRGWIIADNREDLRLRLSNTGQDQIKISNRQSPFSDPFTYFIGVIHEDITMEPFALSSLENNLIVTQILEAAKESARTEKAVSID